MIWSRLPAALEPLAEDGFGLASLVAGNPAGVGVGGVDEVEAAIDEGVEKGKRFFGIDGPAEDVAAEDKRSNLNVCVAESSGLH